MKISFVENALSLRPETDDEQDALATLFRVITHQNVIVNYEKDGFLFVGGDPHVATPVDKIEDLP